MLNGRITRGFVGALLLLANSGCASNYYDAYRAKHPDWVSNLPSKGMTLEEVLASLHAPPAGDGRTTIRKIEILQLDSNGFEPVAFSEVQSEEFVSSDKDHFGVLILEYCRTLMGYNEKTSWYLLESNSLIAWDHYQYADRCASHHWYEPAERNFVALEDHLTSRALRNYPATSVWDAEMYERGLALVRVGRIEEARQCLDRAGEGVEPERQRLDSVNTRNRSRLQTQADSDSKRAKLIHALRLSEPAEDALSEVDTQN